MLARRDVIRATWASQYQNPAWEYRFILGNYSDSTWAPVIEAENATYNDIWAIEGFTNEDWVTANQHKNVELFKYMVQNQGSHFRRYDFVSKVDDDSWVNVPIYYDLFIKPRLPGGDKHQPDGLTLIGRPMKWTRPFVYPSGLMTTFSWSVIEFLAEKYIAGPRDDCQEDELVGYYLYEDEPLVEFVPVELEQAWDIGIEYLIDNGTVIIHRIKDDDRFLEVATLFNEEGKWNGKFLDGLTNFNRTSRESLYRLGGPSDQDMERLQEAWKTTDGQSPRDDLDWELIREAINVEDRAEMAAAYPLSLPGNNVSTGVVPQQLGPSRPRAHYPPNH